MIIYDFPHDRQSFQLQVFENYETKIIKQKVMYHSLSL